jgi:MerE protein
MQAPLSLSRLNRPLSRRNRVGAVVAMLTCPCHVGVAVILCSGTAIGGWLSAEQAWMYVLFTALFSIGLVMFARSDRDACDRCQP